MTAIVVDTSALIAFLDNEPNAERIEEQLAGESDKHMSALNLYECKVVLERRYHEAMQAELELLLARTEMIVHPFDLNFVRAAHRAYRRYGKGTGHAAGLNLGDCAAYATAHALAAPLLFVGDDFSHTDIESCL